MRKDPTEFRERFQRWKKGEQVYENGLALPAYEDGKLSDQQYINIMEKVAADNYKSWGFENEDLALIHALNDNTYNYRGYYNKYPNGDGNALNHWTDEFKTVYHPTFSNESVYSGKKSQYNPKGLKGGHWEYGLFGEKFIPAKWQRKPKYEDGKTPRKLEYRPEEDYYYGGRVFPGKELVVTGKNRKPHTHAPHGMSKNYQKWDTEDLLHAMVTGSDIGDVADVSKDLYNKNYTSAGIGAAMLAIPNVVEKPVKAVAKPISKYLKNFNYLDTTSKLNKNIRTALANDRNPYGYNLYNPNNVLPFVKGTLNTIAGKSIKLKNIADIPIENRNRHIAWRKYLGLKSDDDLIDPFTHQVYGPYVENKRGLFNVATKDDKTKKALDDQFVYSLLNNKGKFLKDGALQNHGIMGHSILKTNDAEYPAILHYYDTWDLQPFNSMTLLPKSIRNFEVSKMIPGAKPFTLDGYAKMNKSQYNEYLNMINTKEGWDKLTPNRYGGNMPLLVPAAAGLGLAATPFAIDMGEDVINWVDEKIKSWSNETGHQR